MKDSNIPLTIITVTFNAEDEIVPTLDSIKKQKDKNFELIIVDGLSKDKTLKLVEQSGLANTIISEKDSGIYDAMNKGVKKAKGKYIYFLNAGDIFYTEETTQTLNKVISKCEDDIIYGKVKLVINDKFKVFEPCNSKNAWKKMPFSHQGCLIKTTYHKSNLYNLYYKISADYDLLYKSIINDATLKEIDTIFAIATPGGVSDIRRYTAICNRWKTINNYTPKIKYNIYYIYLLLDAFLRINIKKILPNKIVNYIRLKKYK
ncbi:glycosyltransferase [Halobacteriovorax sp. RT-1-4]|uniref:glycosyltransferase n=1 Tax=unclassified Halobacteriovorax TaxID=2639665 RepID=UPI003999A8F6